MNILIKKYKSFFRDSLLGFIIGFKLANLRISEFFIIKKKIINIINVMLMDLYNNSYIINNYILIIIIFLFIKRLIKINKTK